MTKVYTSAIQWGNNILYRGIENGKKIQKKIPFSPTLYVDTKNDSKFKTLWNKPVIPMEFNSINEAKEFIKRYDEVDGFNFYGMTQFQYQFIAEEFPDDIIFNINDYTIKIFDIETASEDGFPNPDTALEEVLLISIQDKSTKELVVWGTKPYTRKTTDDFVFYHCNNERELLLKFIHYWSSNYPDIITGWNIDGYDVPYLVNRITRILGEDYAKKLSPWGIISSREVHGKHGQKRTQWDLFGIVSLDYFDLYIKFSYNQRESYTLGSICEEELGETKLDFEGSFKDAYTYQWDKFVQYNAHDTRLVTKLDEKLKFIEVAIAIAYLAKCNIRDVFGPVKTWDVFIFNYLKKKNIVIPQFKPIGGNTIEGAYVKDPIPGLYGWNISFDFSSLYPTIIRQWNMSPETFIKTDTTCRHLRPEDIVENNQKAKSCFEYAKEHNYTIAANGTLYRKDKMGIIPEVVKVVVDGRKIAKKEMLALEQDYEKTKNKDLKPKIAALEGKQMAFKILANALYGSLCNAGFRYTDLNIAEAITLTGQAANKSSSKHFNNFLNNLFNTENKDYVIYGDTDSIYVNIQPLVDILWSNKSEKEIVELLDKTGKKLQDGPATAADKEMFDNCNCFELLMDLKREAIASKGIWSAKKRYALKVHNSEGVDYEKPKIKIKGLDLVKVSTPKAVRKFLFEALNIVFDGDEEKLHKFVNQSKQDFMKLPVEEIALPKSANDIDKWTTNNHLGYKTGTPIQARAAILFNKLNKDGIYPNIKNGDKIKYVYLQMPNKLRENVIGFPSHGKLPEEFGLHSVIDRELQWEKCFVGPLKALTNAINWEIEKQVSLDGVLF